MNKISNYDTILHTKDKSMGCRNRVDVQDIIHHLVTAKYTWHLPRFARLFVQYFLAIKELLTLKFCLFLRQTGDKINKGEMMKY